MRIEPLPPLHNLIAFEATVRHASFSRAAVELHLTQSAVSRQVAQLEEFLGRALFRREHKRIVLTVAGQNYAADVQRLLTQFAESTAQVMARTHEQTLTVASSSGVARLWLAPMLADFVAGFAEVDARLRVVDSLESLVRAEIDLGIYFMRSAPPKGLDARLLFQEKVGAYCSPGYLQGRRLSARDIGQERLLMVEDGQRQWLSWSQWFSLQGVEYPANPRRITVSLYPILIDLAIAGHGIVLGWSPLIDAQLKSGALVPACASQVDGAGGYYLLRPADRLPSRTARQFEQWLVEASEALKA